MEEYYKALSNQYGFQYERETKLSKMVLECRCIVLGMELDIALYGLRVGKNEKYSESKERVRSLNHFMDECLKLDDYNYQIRYQYNEQINENIRLKAIIENLNNQVESYKKQWEEL